MTAPERRVALVTGAARRLGRAVCLELADAGVDIVVHCNRSDEDARRTADDIARRGVAAHVVRGDLADATVPGKIIDDALRAAGRLDVLVNNASTFEPMPLAAFDNDAWHRVLQINLAAPIALIRAALPTLRAQGGCVVNLSDIASDAAWSNYLAYGPSKAGLDYITRALAKSLAPDVRVNGVAPGVVLAPDDDSADAIQRLERIPLGREGVPQDVARTVRFLVESPYITGQTIRVDGGRSIT